MPLEKRRLFPKMSFRFYLPVVFFAALILTVKPFCLHAALQAEDEVFFKKINQDYHEGRFQEALNGYKELSEKYPDHPGILYNLANASFRSGQMGQAILMYERALQYAPRNPDIRANLAHVRGLLEYRIEDKRNWYIRAAENLLGYVRSDEVFLFVQVLYFIFFSTVLFSLFFRRSQPWGAGRKIMLVILFLGVVLAGIKHYDSRVMRDAIVVKEAEVRYGPSAADQVAFRLGEGLKIYVVDNRRDWSRIVLANREGGWIRQSDLAVV